MRTAILHMRKRVLDQIEHSANEPTLQDTCIQVSILIVLFALQAIFSTPSIASDGDLRHESHANGTIIFVHGIFGDRISTWTNAKTSAYFPSLVAKDPTFDHWNIYVAQYPTPKLDPSLSIDQLADNLRSDLESSGIFPGQDLIFVSHSMGGIVTRAFLTRYRDYVPSVRFLYFFSTPTLGADVANWGKLTVELLGQKNSQLKDLERITSDSYLLTRLSDWLAAKFPFPSYCAYETKDTLGIRVVDPGSATALATERVDPIDEDHIAIVQPKDPEARAYKDFKNAFVLTINGHPTKFTSLKVSAVIRFNVQARDDLPTEISVLAAPKLEDQYGVALANGENAPSGIDPFPIQSYWMAKAILKTGISGASGSKAGEATYEISLTHSYVPQGEEAFTEGTLSRLNRIEITVRAPVFHRITQNKDEAQKDESHNPEWLEKAFWMAQSDGQLSVTGVYGSGNSLELINTGYSESVWQDPPLKNPTDVRVQSTGTIGFTKMFSRLREYPTFTRFAK
jgi:pimeloyl-ACP methyl ester carboxylesterase